MPTKIKVLLVDDHAVVRAGFHMLLSTCEEISVVAEAERGEQAILLVQNLSPDVVVMDLSMPGLGGLESIRRMRQRDFDIKILVFSVHEESAYISRALEAGANGYISKRSAAEMLITAIKEINAGNCYVETNLINDKQIAVDVPDYRQIINSFSPREFDVFCLLAKGMKVRTVADELCLGYKTVANYGSQIRTKLKVSTLAELAHIALNLGIVKNS